MGGGCFFLDTESETNPNDNPMMTRAGLSILLLGGGWIG